MDRDSLLCWGCSKIEEKDLKSYEEKTHKCTIAQ